MSSKAIAANSDAEEVVVSLFGSSHPMRHHVAQWIVCFQYSLQARPLTDWEQEVVRRCIEPCYSFGHLDHKNAVDWKQIQDVRATRYSETSTPHNLLHHVYSEADAFLVASWIMYRVKAHMARMGRRISQDRWQQFAIEEAACGAFLLLVRPEDLPHLPPWHVGL